MKKVLLFNYYWPPCGGSAVQRWLHFVKYFEQLNIQTDVVTIDPQKATFQYIDTSLLKEIPASTKVYATDTAELFQLYKKITGKKEIPKTNDTSKNANSLKAKLGRFLRGNFFLPDPRRGWNKYAISKGLSLIAANDYQAIITAGPPQSTHLIGLTLKKKHPQLTWIADFHDYWSNNFNLAFFYRTKLAQFFDEQLEKKVLQKADFVLTHTQKAKELYIQKSNCNAEKFLVVRMGYDDEKMQKPVTVENTAAFQIAYTGIILEDYLPEVFLKALSQVKKSLPQQHIKLVFAGSIFEGLKELIAQYELTDVFEFKGYVSHSESVSLLYSSNLLLMINPSNKHNAQIVPGKLFEYLATEIPVLSISAKGSENEWILNQAGGGANFDWGEEKEIVQFLLTQINNRNKTEQRSAAQLDFIKGMSRSAQAKKIASLI